MEIELSRYILCWLVIIGLCMGSFFNVVILRSLSNESIVFPASKCPKCGNALKPWHNIPVLSYLFLRGKCAFCKEKISIQYPIIELLTAVLYAGCFLKFGITWQTLFAIVLCSCLLIMTMTDLKEKLVDCRIAIALAVVGCVYNFFVNGDILTSILGLLTGVIILEALARLGYLFTGSRAMGEADSYVAGALGACFGFPAILTILLYSLLASMIFILPIFVYNQYKNNNKFVCIMTVLFTTAILVFKTLWQNYFTLGFLALTGLVLSFSILRSIKQEENRNLLPYVPAFTLATLYFLFI